MWNPQLDEAVETIAGNLCRTEDGRFAACGDVVESDAFKAWFGHWDNPKAYSSLGTALGLELPSAVTDAEGRPLVVYHGTRADEFDAFRTEGGEGAVTTMFGTDMVPRTGAFFAEDPEVAASYAGGRGARLVPVYLSIRSPVRLDDVGDSQWFQDELEKVGFNARAVTNHLSNGRPAWELFDGEFGKQFVAALKQIGHDGATFTDTDGERSFPAWVAFDPQQIKSALGNRGTFDPTSAKLAEAVENIVGDLCRSDSGRFSSCGAPEVSRSAEATPPVAPPIAPVAPPTPVSHHLPLRKREGPPLKNYDDTRGGFPATALTDEERAAAKALGGYRDRYGLLVAYDPPPPPLPDRSEWPAIEARFRSEAHERVVAAFDAAGMKFEGLEQVEIGRPSPGSEFGYRGSVNLAVWRTPAGTRILYPYYDDDGWLSDVSYGNNVDPVRGLVHANRAAAALQSVATAESLAGGALKEVVFRGQEPYSYEGTGSAYWSRSYPARITFPTLGLAASHADDGTAIHEIGHLLTCPTLFDPKNEALADEYEALLHKASADGFPYYGPRRPAPEADRKTLKTGRVVVKGLPMPVYGAKPKNHESTYGSLTAYGGTNLQEDVAEMFRLAHVDRDDKGNSDLTREIKRLIAKNGAYDKVPKHLRQRIDIASRIIGKPLVDWTKTFRGKLEEAAALDEALAHIVGSLCRDENGLFVNCGSGDELTVQGIFQQFAFSATDEGVRKFDALVATDGGTAEREAAHDAFTAARDAYEERHAELKRTVNVEAIRVEQDRFARSMIARGFTFERKTTIGELTSAYVLNDPRAADEMMVWKSPKGVELAMPFMAPVPDEDTAYRKWKMVPVPAFGADALAKNSPYDNFGFGMERFEDFAAKLDLHHEFSGGRLRRVILHPAERGMDREYSGFIQAAGAYAATRASHFSDDDVEGVVVYYGKSVFNPETHVHELAHLLTMEGRLSKDASQAHRDFVRATWEKGSAFGSGYGSPDEVYATLFSAAHRARFGESRLNLKTGTVSYGSLTEYGSTNKDEDMAETMRLASIEHSGWSSIPEVEAQSKAFLSDPLTSVKPSELEFELWKASRPDEKTGEHRKIPGHLWGRVALLDGHFGDAMRKLSYSKVGFPVLKKYADAGLLADVDMPRGVPRRTDGKEFDAPLSYDQFMRYVRRTEQEIADEYATWNEARIAESDRKYAELKRLGEAVEQIVGDLCRAEDGQFASCGSSADALGQVEPALTPSSVKIPPRVINRDEVDAFTATGSYPGVRMYHATVALSAVAREGLKSKEELDADGKPSEALGGGSRDTVSLTPIRGFAENVARTVRDAIDIAKSDDPTGTMYDRLKAFGISDDFLTSEKVLYLVGIREREISEDPAEQTRQLEKLKWEIGRSLEGLQPMDGDDKEFAALGISRPAGLSHGGFFLWEKADGSLFMDMEATIPAPSMFVRNPFVETNDLGTNPEVRALNYRGVWAPARKIEWQPGGTPKTVRDEDFKHDYAIRMYDKIRTAYEDTKWKDFRAEVGLPKWVDVKTGRPVFNMYDDHGPRYYDLSPKQEDFYRDVYNAALFNVSVKNFRKMDRNEVGVVQVVSSAKKSPRPDTAIEEIVFKSSDVRVVKNSEEYASSFLDLI